MDIRKFIDLIEKDPPFSYPHPNDKTATILVETAAVKIYNKEFRKIFKKSKSCSTITAIVGRARSGKTHYLKNLELNAGRKYGSISVYLPLFGDDISFDQIIRRIIDDPTFKQAVKELNLEYDIGDPVNLIRKTVNALLEKRGAEVGLILMLDNIDEHLRQREIKLKDKEALKKDIQGLLGLFRRLIEEIPKGLVVIFSLTEDARKRIEEDYLSDPTLRGRFEFIYDPYNPGEYLQLSELTEEEALEFVSKYMEAWAERNGVKLPELKKCMYKDKNLYPFTPEAIKLFVDAGGFAGYICLGCLDTLQEKLDSQSIGSFEDFIITEVDAARAIATKAGMWPYFDTVKERVENSIDWEILGKEINDWINNIGKSKYGELDSQTFAVQFKTGFRELIEYCFGGEGILEFNVSIEDSYRGEEYILDAVVRLKEGTIGFVVTSEGEINKKIGMPIILALRRGEITHGMFIYHGSRLLSRREKLPLLTHDLREELRDYTKLTDYNPVVRTMHISKNPILAWALVYVSELKVKSKKMRVLAWIDRNVRLKDAIIKLIKEKSKRISIDRPDGSILDRAGA